MTTITLVQQGAIGDTVLLLPLLGALRHRFADSRCAITLVTRPSLGQMFTMFGFVEAFASADDRVHSCWFGPPAGDHPASLPPWARADLLISAVSNGRDHWADNARLARRGLAGPFPDAGIWFIEPRPPVDYPGHVTQWHRRQLASLDLVEPPLPPLRCNPQGAVLIHPGSGQDAKCWPRQHFLSLGYALKKHGFPPIFLLGETELERWGRAAVDALQADFVWYLHIGLWELAHRMTQARFYIGNDSGITHLAAAMGLPVVALFGPSSDLHWRPVGPRVRVLRAAKPHEERLEALEVSTVLEAVLTEMGGVPPS